MNLQQMADQAAQIILPYLPALLGEGHPPAPGLEWQTARQVWEMLSGVLRRQPQARETLQTIARRDFDARAGAVLSWQIEALFAGMEAATLAALASILEDASRPVTRSWKEPVPGDLQPKGLPDAPMFFSSPQMSPTRGDDSAEERFLVAEITDFPDQHKQPLSLHKEFTLALFVDTSASAFPVRFDDGRVFQPGESKAHLHVFVTSQDFIVHTRQAQVLRLERTGPSRNKARFDLEPRQPGKGKATVLFYKDNNFVQGLEITLNVETGDSAISSVESLGRPLDEMGALQKRDALLFIKNTGNGFDLTLVSSGVSQAHLPLKLEELNLRIQEARQALHEVVFLAQGPDRLYVHPRDKKVPNNVNLVYQTALTIATEAAQEAQNRLAEAGWILYDSLFNAPAAGQDARDMGNTLRQLAAQAPLKLQIISQEFFLPWGMLYLPEIFDPDDIQIEYFLGFRHIIEHIPLQKQMPLFDSAIPSQPRLQVSVNVNTDLPQATGQVAFWRQPKIAAGVELAVRQNDQDWLTALKSPGIPEKILYFYGHATTKGLGDAGGPDASALTFAGEASVSLRDLRIKAPALRRFANAPLVFINACESAELSPLFYGGFMPYFIDKGARGMIGTECEVPAIFADEWAKRFFERFLFEEKPVGQIFLELRREFYSQHNNLLGLLYALYCDGDTKVTPGL